MRMLGQRKNGFITAWVALFQYLTDKNRNETTQRALELQNAQNMEELAQNERLARLDADVNEKMAELDAEDDSEVIIAAIVAIAVVVIIINWRQ